jgi:hypothetical protein
MPAQARLSSTMRGYGRRHQAIREELEPLVLAGGVSCARCGEPITDNNWHLGHTDDRTGYTGPEHARCNILAAGEKAARMRWSPPPPPEPEPEREGLAADHPCWRVSWLDGLLEPPPDAVWPRYMTAPHPAATGSLGPEFIEWAEAREERPLRWWQRLVATRLLEVDGEELVWGTMLLTMARQLGKSWLLRELLLWRMHQRQRFGEPQDVMHIGKDLQVCKEILRPALFWADERPGYKTGRAAGEMYIELLEDHSRWMLRAKGSINGYSANVAAVDEAWKVPTDTVTELTPILTARNQPQLWLISTAHRDATALMLARRKAAIEHLETDTSTLLVEWSTPKTADIGDVSGWRLASPHWTRQRERLIREELDAVLAGTAEVYEGEPDPQQGFQAQWLNRWPDRTMSLGAGEPLLPPGLWAYLAEPGLRGSGPLHVTVEDDFGKGAAVAAAAMLDDGRLEVDGWLCPDWDKAMLEVLRLAALREIRELLVGASLLARVPQEMTPEPQPAGSAETRLGLPLLRDLATNGMVAHADDTDDLDLAVTQAQVKQLTSGLQLQSGHATHLVKAMLWAVYAAHAPEPVPVIF